MIPVGGGLPFPPALMMFSLPLTLYSLPSKPPPISGIPASLTNRHVRNANDELLITAKTLRFFTMSWAAVRLAPDDASSIAWRSILRPLTPPLAFWASTRASHALPASSKLGLATPVPDQM